MTKVLICDDSALMRKQLSTVLTDAGFIVDFANDGKHCLDKIAEFKPNVVTLDINMPVMDGLTCLKQIMKDMPVPVVMISSLTEKGAKASFEALEYGAVDYIPKPSGAISIFKPEAINMIVQKVRNAAKMRVAKRVSFREKFERSQQKSIYQAKANSIQHISRGRNTKLDLIVMGVSTGGPGTIQEIISSLPADFAVPIVIAQHMPERFTSVFANRLNGACAMSVSEVTSESHLQPGNVYIAKGDADIEIRKRGATLYAASIGKVSGHIWHPSIEHLVDSAAEQVNCSRLMCVQLTGMGNDGAEAMAKANKKGAKTIAESKETAVVYGMPRELVAKGGADQVLANFKIAHAILEAVYG
ncbi:chemotaxis-specific protein-glutamate methyltransferase CheB [Glaciecola sp. 1036]|uniref:chemotaxis-specific protein-glutamate methyltransferase CheB n=1 Tax=Alteromonadaceae TaxID=72275 RepID=UPI003D0883E5